MRQHLKTLFRAALVGLVVLYVAGAFLPFEIDPLVGVPALLIFAVGFPCMTRSFRIASTIFACLGAALLLWSGRPVADWLGAASSMCNIVVIVAVMQTFSIPIHLGGYDEAIRAWSERRFGTRSSLFAFITVTTTVLASFLNIGSVPVLVSLFEDALKRRLADYRRYFSVCTSRAYFLMTLWSPGSINLYLVVQATGVGWSAVFFPGLIIAIFGMAFSYVIELGKHGLLGRAVPAARPPAHEAAAAASAEPPAPMPPPAAPVLPPVRCSRGPSAGASSAMIVHIPLVTLAFALAIVGMELAGFASSGQRIILAGGLISALWTLGLSRRPGLAALAKSYWKDGTLKAAEIGPFFVAIGIFSQGLQKSGLLDYIGPSLRAATGALGPASVVFVAALIVGFSIVGLHPFISIILFGTMLSGAGLPIPPLTIALALSVGGAAAYMISPFAGVIMTIARLVGVRPFDLAVRWNWRYSLSFMALGLAFSFAWGRLFG